MLDARRWARVARTVEPDPRWHAAMDGPVRAVPRALAPVDRSDSTVGRACR